MPLMSLSKMYKSFPPTFAEGFSHHVRREDQLSPRHQPSPRQHPGQSGVTRREQLKKKQAEEVVFSSDEFNIYKRQRKPDDPADTPYMTRCEGRPPGRGQRQDVGSWWAFKPTSRGAPSDVTLTSRGAPSDVTHTPVSLEMVDLWESDSEETESKDNGEFDQINGVVINPRKTFDFSELSRLKETSDIVDTTMTHKKHVSRKPHRQKQSDMREEEFKIHTSRMSKDRTCKDDKIYYKVQQGDIDSHTVTDKCTQNINKKTVAERFIHKVKDGKVSDMTSSQREEERGRDMTSSHREQERGRDMTSSQREQERGRDMTSSQREQERGRDMTSSQREQERGSKVKPRVKPVPGLHHVFSPRRHTDRRSDNPCVQSMRDLESVKMADVPQHTYPPPSQKRKVKFNKVVSVREGEENKLDFLRTSKNSGQLFKQRYLMPRDARPTTPTPGMGSRVLLAY